MSRAVPVRGGPGLAFLEGLADHPRGRPVPPSLGVIETLVGRLGHPERRFTTLHVTGTNGKSSTARYAAGLLAATGRRVGLYTSPHLRSVAERIEIDQSPVDPERLEAGLARVREVAAGLSVSFFEAITAACFVIFAAGGVEVAVVEVGILGRYDATNVVASDVAVITNVGRDHLDYAGSAPGAVAREKAGILKATTRACVLGDTPPDLLAAVAVEAPARLVRYGDDFRAEPVEDGAAAPRYRIERPAGAPVALELESLFHARNASTALVAVDALLGRPLEADLAGLALRAVRLRGRAEVCSREPLVVADVGHNPEAAAALRAALERHLAPGQPVAFVVAMTGARQPSAFLAPLVRPGDAVVACEAPGGPGPVPAELVAKDAAALGAEASVAGELSDAYAEALGLARSRGAAVVVTGSFRIVGPFLEGFGPAPEAAP